MSRRKIGQEELMFTGPAAPRRSSLDELTCLIDWAPVAQQLDDINSAAKGEPAWPPLALFKALLIAVWLRLVRREACRSSGRSRFVPTVLWIFIERGDAGTHGFRAVSQGTRSPRRDKGLFDAVTRQLKAKAATVKTGTLVDATVIASASHQDGEAAWAGHRRRKAVHGCKAHVGADADTALVEELSVTPGNGHDGQAGHGALPDDPGDVLADSGSRGQTFASAVLAKGGVPKVVRISAWGRPGDDTASKLKSWNDSVQRVRCRIEKIFGTWKRSYGLRRMRWRGLSKATLQVRLTAIAYNLKRTSTILKASNA